MVPDALKNMKKIPGTGSHTLTCTFHERSGAGREGGDVQERWIDEGDIFPLRMKEKVEMRMKGK